MERTKIKIITNSGFVYKGELIEKNSNFTIIIDEKEGRIEVPLVNISLLKEVREWFSLRIIKDVIMKLR